MTELLHGLGWFEVAFEPLNKRAVIEAAGMPFRPYLRPADPAPEMAAFWQQVLVGGLRAEWVRRYRPAAAPRRVLIKEIRATLIGGWLADRLGCEVVYVTRDARAVVASRLALGWEPHLDELVRQPHLVADYLEPHLDTIRSLRTPAQKHAAMWCIENLVPIDQMRTRPWLWIAYEEACADPEGTLRRLGCDLAAIAALDPDRPSTTARMPAALRRVELHRRAEMWREEIGRRERAVVESVVRDFGLECRLDGMRG